MNPVSAIGMIGAGTMGVGIAYVFAQAGCAVTVVEPDRARVAAAHQTIAARANRLQAENRLSAESAEHIRASLSFVESVDELAIDLDLIVEAVPEDLELKQSILAAAERREPVMLASNTSALSISQMSKSLRRPQNLIGLHFFNPVWSMPLLEIVRGSGSAPPDRSGDSGDVVRRRRKVPPHERIPQSAKAHREDVPPMTDILPSYICGRWQHPADDGKTLLDAATAEPIVRVSNKSLDYPAVLDYARTVGGPALRDMTFQQRASTLKALGKHLSTRIPQLTELSLSTGATRRDSAIDIDGGIGVLFVYASKGAKELPDQHILRDGDFEPLGKAGSFGVQHIVSPLLGAFVQINAFNFPIWGMLEKFAPAFLAGVPSIVKPASQTAYLTELAVREIIASGLIPEGALQLVCARPDGLLESLTGQDVVSVTGSHATATAVRRHPTIAGNAVRFTAEADSLNSSILGEDVTVGSPEFEIFVRGLVTEMTQKTGQKCTAIRRAFVPRALADDVESAVCERLSKITVGDPRGRR